MISLLFDVNVCFQAEWFNKARVFELHLQQSFLSRQEHLGLSDELFLYEAISKPRNLFSLSSNWSAKNLFCFFLVRFQRNGLRQFSSTIFREFIFVSKTKFQERLWKRWAWICSPPKYLHYWLRRRRALGSFSFACWIPFPLKSWTIYDLSLCLFNLTPFNFHFTL